MYRPNFSSPSFNSQRSCASSFHEALNRLFVILTLWICVSLGIRYGYYGNCRLILGPNSSRLVEVSSVFVEQIQVRGDEKKGFLLYGFLEKPELSLETNNWSVSNYLFLDSYKRKGISLWLNKGSRIRIAWKVTPTAFHNVFPLLIKGEKNQRNLLKHCKGSNALALKNPKEGNGEVDYSVEEDNSYYVGIANLNPLSVVLSMTVEVSSKVYDTVKAKSICSIINGFCRLKLPFPNTQFVVLTTPNKVDSGAWFVELSFVARLLTYVVILGFIVIVIALILKYLGACESAERVEEEVRNEPEIAGQAGTETETETDPLMPNKDVPCLYGAFEEDVESGLSTSSKDLYDGKICVICYDETRNCFFVPCGHCATCYSCAQRIVEGENRGCPICRRFIHKIRRLPLERDSKA